MLCNLSERLFSSIACPETRRHTKTMAWSGLSAGAVSSLANSSPANVLVATRSLTWLDLGIRSMSHFCPFTTGRSSEFAPPFFLHACACVVVGFLLTGCGSRDSVQIELLARVPPGHGGPNLQITAQIAGRQDGLRYKWFAVNGGCDPQASDNPQTAFRFADGTMRDRISVEAWRGNKMVGQ